LLLIIILVTGCKKNEEIEDNQNSSFELVKINDDEDYLYFEDVGIYKFSDGTECSLKLPIFNVDSDDVSNVNIEIRSYIRNIITNFKYDGDLVVNGNKVEFEYYISDEVISLNIFNTSYVGGSKVIYGDEDNQTYVVSLKTGKYLGNEDLLELYEYDEEKMFNQVEELVESDDLLYSMMSIKNYGYDLYVNNDNKLCVLFYENTDEERIRKELVLDD